MRARATEVAVGPTLRSTAMLQVRTSRHSHWRIGQVTRTVRRGRRATPRSCLRAAARGIPRLLWLWPRRGWRQERQSAPPPPCDDHERNEIHERAIRAGQRETPIACPQNRQERPGGECRECPGDDRGHAAERSLGCRPGKGDSEQEDEEPDRIPHDLGVTCIVCRPQAQTRGDQHGRDGCVRGDGDGTECWQAPRARGELGHIRILPSRTAMVSSASRAEDQGRQRAPADYEIDHEALVP